MQESAPIGSQTYEERDSYVPRHNYAVKLQPSNLKTERTTSVFKMTDVMISLIWRGLRPGPPILFHCFESSQYILNAP